VLFWKASQARIEFGPTASKVESKRTSQRLLILGRLQKGPARWWELMQIGKSGFSSRLSELKRDGHVIRCDQDEDGGLYTLVIE
jgi:DNA-binding HxlR family transcriptional regulator